MGDRFLMICMLDFWRSGSVRIVSDGGLMGYRLQRERSVVRYSTEGGGKSEGKR